MADGDDDGNDPDVIATYDVTVLGFGISKLEVVDDPDGVVSAGPQIMVRATVRSAVAASEVRLTVPGTSGMSIETDADAGTTSQGQVKIVDDGATPAAPLSAPGTGYATFTINTAGAPTGEYTLTFVADQDGDFATRDGSTEDNKQASDPLTVTIGEAGLGVSSATLSLGNKTNDVAYTTDDETVPESGTAAASNGTINLVIEVFNALGNKARTGDINQITVIAPGGAITTTHNLSLIHI